MRKLNTYVHVDGVAYGPDSVDIPAHVAERITAPGVWEGEDDRQEQSEAERAVEQAAEEAEAQKRAEAERAAELARAAPAPAAAKPATARSTKGA